MAVAVLLLLLLLLLLASAAASVAAPIVCAKDTFYVGVAGLFGGSGQLVLATLARLCGLSLPVLSTIAGTLLTIVRRPLGGIVSAVVALTVAGGMVVTQSLFLEEHSPFPERPQIDPSAIDRPCGNPRSPDCPAGYSCFGYGAVLRCEIQCSAGGDGDCPDGAHCVTGPHLQRDCH